MQSAEEAVVTVTYLAGAVLIVLATLSVGWILVWKCVLAKMPFVQELFDLKPRKSKLDGQKLLSFEERYAQYKRVRLSIYPPCNRNSICVLLYNEKLMLVAFTSRSVTRSS